MNTCLMTKLKSVVDNPDLPLLNEGRIYFERVETPDVNSQSLGLTVSEPMIIKVLNGTFINSSLEDTGETTQSIVANSTQMIYVSNGATLVIPNKNAIITLNSYQNYGANAFNTKNKYLNSEIFKYNHSLKQLSIGNNRKIIVNLNDLINCPLTMLDIEQSINIVGDVDVLNKDGIYRLSLGSSGVTGTASNLGKFKKLTSLGISQCQGITGTMEDFVESYINNGGISHVNIYHTDVLKSRDINHLNIYENSVLLYQAGGTPRMIEMRVGGTTVSTYNTVSHEWNYDLD